MIDIASYKGLYIKTATECVNAIKNSLQVLDKNVSNTEALEVAHRNAHSLKSESMTMGYPKTSELAKAIEILLNSVIEGATTLEKKTVADLENCADLLENSIDKINKNNQEEDLEGATQEILKYLKK